MRRRRLSTQQSRLLPAMKPIRSRYVFFYIDCAADLTLLQAGKIKNKVLKLMATVIKLQAQQAQGDDTVADKLAEEMTKLQNNIDQDTAAAGQVSIAEPFDATISGGGN